MNLDWIALIYVMAFGACIGSFLNVVVYRLPIGKSLITPPSSCPGCSHRLAWHDNVPVFGWLWLRGKCRYCATGISIQYPLVEAMTALFFGALFYAYYMAGAGGGYFQQVGLSQTWVVLIVHLVLLAALIAATLIDAKLFIIPLQIPWFTTIVAAMLLPLSAWLYPLTTSTLSGEFRWFIPETHWLMPVVNGPLLGVALGGTAGLVAAVVLLQFKVLPLSFADEPQAHDHSQPVESTVEPAVNEEHPPAMTMTDEEQEAYLAYPHARREMGKELLFLALPVVGMIAGCWLWKWLDASQGLDAPLWAQTFGGVMLGYLVGGGVVWGTRIFGTLMFGKEAMGLGDVHLLAAVGAVLGAKEVTVLFFIAPFFGLLYALLSAVLGSVTRWKWRMIPYGPFLAAASVLMMLTREPVLRYLGLW